MKEGRKKQTSRSPDLPSGLIILKKVHLGVFKNSPLSLMTALLWSLAGAVSHVSFKTCPASLNPYSDPTRRFNCFPCGNTLAGGKGSPLSKFVWLVRGRTRSGAGTTGPILIDQKDQSSLGSLKSAATFSDGILKSHHANIVSFSPCSRPGSRYFHAHFMVPQNRDPERWLAQVPAPRMWCTPGCESPGSKSLLFPSVCCACLLDPRLMRQRNRGASIRWGCQPWKWLFTMINSINRNCWHARVTEEAWPALGSTGSLAEEVTPERGSEEWLGVHRGHL